MTGKAWLDPLLAGVFAVNIGWGGYKLLSNSINELLDHDLPFNLKEEVIAVIADCNQNIIDVHNFRGRRSGQKYFFDFHVTLPSHLDFTTVHEITESVEKRIEERFDADVVVHADPAALTDDNTRTSAGMRRTLHPIDSLQ